MLVKRTSKNQFTLPKALLKAAGISEKDQYFSAEVDSRRHLIFLKSVQVVIEEKISDETIRKFESEALTLQAGDVQLKSRKAADEFLASRLKK